MAEVSGDDGGDADDGSNLGLCQHTDVNEIKQLRRVQRGLYSRLHKLRMPNNPLDDLIQQLGGPTVVAELTGRKGRLDVHKSELQEVGDAKREEPNAPAAAPLGNVHAAHSQPAPPSPPPPPPASAVREGTMGSARNARSFSARQQQHT